MPRAPISNIVTRYAKYGQTALAKRTLVTNKNSSEQVDTQVFVADG